MVYTWSELFWIFYIYSFIGWCAGVIANALRRRRFVNTGFLNIPLCPIYGIMGVAYCIFLPELTNKIFFLFLGGCVIAFIIIVVTGAVLEKAFNRKWWDYSKRRFQFQGYLNFIHLIFFGVSAVICMRFINPLLVKLMSFIPGQILLILEIVFGVILLVDTVCCVTTVLQIKHTIKTHKFVDYVQGVTENFGNVLTKKVQHRMEKAYPNIEKERIIETEEHKKESKVFAEGCCFYKIVGLFFIGAFLDRKSVV